MVISPVVIIICAAIIIFTIIFYIINRPRKPIFTGVLLFLLLGFALMTLAVNGQLSVMGSTAIATKNATNILVSFITLSDNPSQQILTQSFDLFCKIDIGLIIAVVISMTIEVRNLLHSGKKTK
ncbi:MAG TPA: hypothetical protein GX401_08370 [Clostridiales bacterium]|nr:hypothetical protein [Clostridiales bacterium]